MGFLVNELETLVYRVMVLSDSHDSLKDVFQDMSMEVTTELSPGQNLEWKAGVFSKDSIFPFFCAATLGQRGKLKCRVHFVGHTINSEQEIFDFCEMADLVLLDIRFERPDSAIFMNKIRQTLTKPCAIRGFKGNTVLPSDELRAKALRKWAEERFSKLLLLKENDKLVQRSLDWALSFS